MKFLIFNFPHLILMVNLSPIMLIKLLLFFLTLLVIFSSSLKDVAQVGDKAQSFGVQKCEETMNLV